MLRHAIETNLQIFTKFLVISASCSGISHARKLFDQRPEREDTFLCNSMIKSYLETRHYPDSLSLYKDLREETCFAPENFTFTTLIKSSTLSVCVDEGLQLHSQIWRSGFVADMYVSTGVVDMYAKFGKMRYAKKVFDKMPQRSEVSWTALICGYAKCGELDVASKLFDEMPEVKDVVIYNAMIDGFVKSGDMVSARGLFVEIRNKTVITWTTMIHGYCNNKEIESARELFDAMPEKNLVSWNTMISGYSQNKQAQEAIRLFQEMQETTLLDPDDVTIVSVLPAISDTGAITLAQRKKYDKKVKVCTAILDMYSKCGEIEKAKRMFDEILPEKKEVASWNAMIYGYALNGNARAALELFLVMLKEEEEEVKPDEVMLLAVLSACNHGGFVEEGKKWFRIREEEFGVIPKIEHFGCMVDLLGRAGEVKEAEDLIRRMPFEANGIILSSFLSSCGSYKDIERAERILKKMEPNNDGNYVLLRNLYAADKRWEDVGKVKKMMRNKEAKKEVGCSAIEVNGLVSEFISGDTTHSYRRNIDLVLEKLVMHMKDEEAITL